jgi:hypothetical protein
MAEGPGPGPQNRVIGTPAPTPNWLATEARVIGDMRRLPRDRSDAVTLRYRQQPCPVARGRHDPGCSTRAFAAPDRRVIESQSVTLSANSLRSERRSTDGQVILEAISD